MVLTSLLYIALYVYDLSSLPAPSIVEALQLDWNLTAKLRQVNTMDVYVFILLKNFVLPVMHVVLVIGVASVAWVSRKAA